MAQEILKDVLRANDRRITIEEIQKKVADHFNIKLIGNAFGPPRPVCRQTTAGGHVFIKTADLSIFA